MKLISSIAVFSTLLTQAWSVPAQTEGKNSAECCAGGVHAQTEGKKPAECYGGGMRQHPPLVNPNTPPCWYLQADGKYDCYDYASNGKCPWAGYADPKPQ